MLKECMIETGALPQHSFKVRIPEKWAISRASSTIGKEPHVPLPLATAVSTNGIDHLRLIAIPIKYSLNPLDLVLCQLLRTKTDVYESGGYESPVGKIGRFAYKRVHKDQTKIEGRIFATRNDDCVLVVQVECADPKIDLDAIIESIEFVRPKLLQLEEMAIHGLDDWSFELPNSWQNCQSVEMGAKYSHVGFNHVVFFAHSSTIATNAPAQVVFQEFLTTLASEDLRYQGAPLLPTPARTEEIRRFRMQTECTYQGKPACMLAMHHRFEKNSMDLAVCMPLALKDPIAWACGKFGMESALSTLKHSAIIPTASPNSDADRHYKAS